MRKLLLLSLSCTIIILMLTSCVSTNENKSNDKDKNNRVLTVYLNDFDDIIGPLFEEATGYKVNIVQGSGAEILSRIEAERGNPHWDVVWIDMISSIHGLGLKDQLLDGFIPENSVHLKDSFKNFIPEQKWYYPTSAHASAVMIYNHETLPVAHAPTSWEDFNKQELKGIVGIADPTIAAPAYAFINWFFYKHGLDEGRQMISQWMNNDIKIFPKNPNVAMALLSGQIKAAALQENDAYLLLKQKLPMTVVWPAEGAPASVRVAAISKHTELIEEAKAFVNFLLDPAIQQVIIERSDEAYHDPSAVGVKSKSDREPNTNLVFSDTLWSYQHEAEIKQWFVDFSVQ